MPPQASSNQSARPPRLSARNRFVIAAVTSYALFAILWIFLSDQLLTGFVDIERLRWFSTFKGSLFVLITSMMLAYALYAVPAADLPSDSTGFAQNPHASKLGRYGFAITVTLAFMVLRANLGL